MRGGRFNTGTLLSTVRLIFLGQHVSEGKRGFTGHRRIFLYTCLYLLWLTLKLTVCWLLSLSFSSCTVCCRESKGWLQWCSLHKRFWGHRPWPVVPLWLCWHPWLIRKKKIEEKEHENMSRWFSMWWIQRLQENKFFSKFLIIISINNVEKVAEEAWELFVHSNESSISKYIAHRMLFRK